MVAVSSGLVLLLITEMLQCLSVLNSKHDFCPMLLSPNAKTVNIMGRNVLAHSIGG